MWWFDDSLYRANSRQPANVPLSNAWPASVGPSPAADLPFLTSDLGKRPRIWSLQLSADEIAANQVFLELGAENENDSKRLLKDVQALEKTIRDQKQLFTQKETEFEAKVQQLNEKLGSFVRLADSSVLAFDELEKTHQIQTELLENKLTQLQEESAHRETRATETTLESKRLRDLLSEAEQTLATRDDELVELQLHVEVAEQDFANQIAELEDERNRQASSLANENQTLLASLRDLTDRFSSSQVDFQSAVADRDAFAADLADEQQQHARLRERHAITWAELQDSEDSMEDFKQQASQEKGDLQEQLRLRTIELQTSQESIEAFKQQATQEKGDLQEQLRLRTIELQTSQESIEAFKRQATQEQGNVQEQLRLRSIELQEVCLEADRLRSENERLETELSTKVEERVLSLESFNERERGHARQLASLTHRVDAVRAERDQWKAELDTAIAERDKVRDERDAAVQRLESLHGEKSEAEKAQQKAHADEIKKAFFRLSEEASAKQLTNDKVIHLTEALNRQQDSSLEQARRAKDLEYDLRKRIDELEKELAKRDEAIAERDQEVQEKSSDFEHRVSELTRVLESRQSELQSLSKQSESSQTELQRRGGTIEKVKQENERLVELHTAQFSSLQTRVDQLIIDLDEEKYRRTIAEQEARRLCIVRSERIHFLSRQREELLLTVKSLQENRTKEHPLQTAVNAATHSLDAVNETLSEKSKELEHLRMEYETGRLRGREVVERYRLRLEIARKQIDELTAKSVWAHRELRRCRDLLRQNQQVDAEPLDESFGILQRDRLIVSLEQNAIVMQQRMQREAATRRKMESLLKRKIKQKGDDTALKAGWSKLDTRNQIERLQRQIVALKSINHLERQRSQKQIETQQKELARLRGDRGQQAA